MSASKNKFRASLMEAMKLDQQKLEVEMQTVAPHVFSDEHEAKMKKLFHKQKRRQTSSGVFRYVVAACLVLLCLGSIFIISSEKLQASRLSIDIIEWLEDFFSTEKGTDDRRKENETIFSEDQIGYLPEGFEKTVEFENMAFAYHKYENADGKMIQIIASKDKTSLKVDNMEDVYEVSRNEAGYEYTGTYKPTEEGAAVIWMDKEEIYYYVMGTVSYEEILNVMNGISCK